MQRRGRHGPPERAVCVRGWMHAVVIGATSRRVTLGMSCRVVPRIQEDSMPVSPGPPRAVMRWLPSGFDVEFLLRESRPSSLHDLVRKDNRAWRQLFSHWLSGDARYGEPAATQFWAIAQAYDGSGWRAVRGHAPDSVWTPRINRFREICATIRDEMKARRTEVARTKRKLGSRDLDERVAQEWRQGEEVARMSGLSAENVTTLVRLEAAVVRRTREIKPQIIETYGKYQAAVRWESGNREKAMNAFATAHGHLSSAEAELRRTTDLVRRTGSGPLTEAQVVDLRAAWTDYLTAWTELINATIKLGEVYVAWARKNTKKKITENFAAVHPVANGCLLAVHTLLLSFRTTLVATELAALPLTAGISTEVVGILNSAMGLAAEFADQLVKSAIGTRDARNDAVVEEHLGRRYRKEGAGEDDPDDDGPGYGTTVVEAIGAAVPKIVETAGRTAMHLATSTSQKATVARSLPLVGEFLTGAGLLVRWHDQLFPKQLERKSSVERERLVDAFRHAREWLGDHDVHVEEATVHRVLGDGAFEISFGEVRGVLRHGRFSPDDPRERVAVVVAAWRRSLGDTPVVLVDNESYQLLTGHGDEFEWHDVPEFLVEEAGAEFVLVLPARPVWARTTRAAVRVRLSAEGNARLELASEPPGPEFDLDALPLDLHDLVDSVVLDMLRFQVDAGILHPDRYVVELVTPGCVSVSAGGRVLDSYLLPLHTGGVWVTPDGLDAGQWAVVISWLETEEVRAVITRSEIVGPFYARCADNEFYVANEQNELVVREG